MNLTFLPAPKVGVQVAKVCYNPNPIFIYKSLAPENFKAYSEQLEKFAELAKQFKSPIKVITIDDVSGIKSALENVQNTSNELVVLIDPSNINDNPTREWDELVSISSVSTMHHQGAVVILT